MKITLCLFCTLLTHVMVQAQGFQPVPGCPIANFRHDDFHFSGPDSIWIVNQGGEIFRTTDAGQTWDTLVAGGNFYGRSVGFFNHNIGLMGQYGAIGSPSTIDSNAIFITNDAGISWSPVTAFSGITPKGICGISIVNDSVAVGVGRFDGDAVFVRTVDQGANFQSLDMSMYSDGLIDCHFFSSDTGLITGLDTAGFSWETAKATVLYTVDGGSSWQQVYAGTDLARWGWKIQFISRDTGFISLENHFTLSSSDPHYFLKTVDGGLTWQKYPVFTGTGITSRLQGIGFINDTIGYTGEAVIRKTTDGGISWTVNNELFGFNRYRKVNDTLMYALGRTLYKYHQTPTGVTQAVGHSTLQQLTLHPNPASEQVKVEFHLKQSSGGRLSAYNQAGIRIFDTQLNHLKPGKNVYRLDIRNWPAGIYYITFSVKKEVMTGLVVKQ